ncbi:MAG: helix-turn-helix transcriptional regulator [Bacteroidales bacterium]|nr:helix-turn-helix transcriptional regulator [Bacteroidales bacterium]
MRKVTAVIETGLDRRIEIYVGDDTYPYGILGEGHTIAEAKEDFMIGYQEMKEYVLDSGKEFEEAEFVFRYDIPSFLQEFAYAFTLSGLERITGINQKQLGHYVSGYRKPSAKTIRKMEEGIHNFSEQLSRIHFYGL